MITPEWIITRKIIVLISIVFVIKIEFQLSLIQIDQLYSSFDLLKSAKDGGDVGAAQDEEDETEFDQGPEVIVQVVFWCSDIQLDIEINWRF